MVKIAKKGLCTILRLWFSGRFLACHAGNRVSIPHQRRVFYFSHDRLMNLVKNCYHHPHGQKLESLQHMSKEERDHQFLLPKVYTERFKQSLLNKCLFNDFRILLYGIY